MRLQALAMLGQVGGMAYGNPPASPWLTEDVESFNERFKIALTSIGADLPGVDPVEVSLGALAMAEDVESFNERYKIAINLSDLFIHETAPPESFGFEMLADELLVNNRRYVESLATLTP